MKNIEELFGKDLAGFQVINATEVYRVNEEGMFAAPIAFFKDNSIAQGFAGLQTEKNYTRIRMVRVLTNGTISFALVDTKPVTFLNEEQEAVKIKTAALQKLTTVEKELLRLG